MGPGDNKLLLYLALLLALILVAGSSAGLFLPGIYDRESLNWREQTKRQDFMGLVVITPLLATSAIRMFCGRKDGYFLLGGTLLFLTYSYAIYCFALHFNSLFLLNCTIFGLSFYLFLLLIVGIPMRLVKSWFCRPVPFRSTSLIIVISAGVFTLLWLKEIIPALLSHTIPRSIAQSGLLINPVHVLDLAILLPGMLLTAILLRRRHALGWVLAPMLLIFAALMTINIAVLVVGKPGALSYANVVLTIFFVYAAWHFLRPLNRSNDLCF